MYISDYTYVQIRNYIEHACTSCCFGYYTVRLSSCDKKTILVPPLLIYNTRICGSGGVDSPTTDPRNGMEVGAFWKRVRSGSECVSLGGGGVGWGARSFAETKQQIFRQCCRPSRIVGRGPTPEST